MMRRHLVVPTAMLGDPPALNFLLDRRGYARQWTKLADAPYGWSLLEVHAPLARA